MNNRSPTPPWAFGLVIASHPYPRSGRRCAWDPPTDDGSCEHDWTNDRFSHVRGLSMAMNNRWLSLESGRPSHLPPMRGVSRVSPECRGKRGIKAGVVGVAAWPGCMLRWRQSQSRGHGLGACRKVRFFFPFFLLSLSPLPWPERWLGGGFTRTFLSP